MRRLFHYTFIRKMCVITLKPVITDPRLWIMFGIVEVNLWYFFFFRDTPLATVFCGAVAEEVQIFCFSESWAESFGEAGWRNLVFCFSLFFWAPGPGTVQIKGEQRPLCVCVCVHAYVHFLLCPICLVLCSINIACHQ